MRKRRDGRHLRSIIAATQVNRDLAWRDRRRSRSESFAGPGENPDPPPEEVQRPRTLKDQHFSKLDDFETELAASSSGCWTRHAIGHESSRPIYRPGPHGSGPRSPGGDLAMGIGTLIWLMAHRQNDGATHHPNAPRQMASAPKPGPRFTLVLTIFGIPVSTTHTITVVHRRCRRREAALRGALGRGGARRLGVDLHHSGGRHRRGRVRVCAGVGWPVFRVNDNATQKLGRSCFEPSWEFSAQHQHARRGRPAAGTPGLPNLPRQRTPSRN